MNEDLSTLGHKWDNTIISFGPVRVSGRDACVVLEKRLTYWFIPISVEVEEEEKGGGEVNGISLHFLLPSASPAIFSSSYFYFLTFLFVIPRVSYFHFCFIILCFISCYIAGGFLVFLLSPLESLSHLFYLYLYPSAVNIFISFLILQGG